MTKHILRWMSHWENNGLDFGRFALTHKEFYTKATLRQAFTLLDVETGREIGRAVHSTPLNDDIKPAGYIQLDGRSCTEYNTKEEVFLGLVIKAFGAHCKELTKAGTK
ncbi:hypothetical protein [Canibacter zhoujuaniae]|uniref:hypothetical protein n=1 Tax=Canibacter zhoujuaniae TaxID=2708343 RepID=UPI0014226FBB|nr:hypothetical protein [Canibacter zhoujuaniae]